MSNSKRKLIVKIIIGVFAAILLLVVGAIIMEKVSSHSSNSGNYQEQVMSVEQMEKLDPLNFLRVDGTFNPNFWGNKFTIKGKIKNSATVAIYKDAVVRVEYYSKTKTLLGNEDYTIYEILPPSSTTKFELKVTKYKNVQSIGCDIIDAKVY